MFDQFYCNEQNSLDLLLKFSTQSEQPCADQDYHFEANFKELPATAQNINTLMDLLSCPLEEPEPDTDREILQMRQAAQQQEEKVTHLTKHNKERPKILSLLKRKASECTEAPNSPTRKTKIVRKEKP